MMRIFVNSVPKSGTNLMQRLMDLLGIQWSGRSMTATSGWGQRWHEDFIKYVLRSPHGQAQPVSIGVDNPSAVSSIWLRGYLAAAKGYVTGHAAYSEHLHHILRELDYKIIMVIRHPGALLYSWARYIGEPGYYWQEAHKALSELSVEERFRLMLTGGAVGDLYYPSLTEILWRASRWFEQPDVLVVRFEDLVGSKGGGDDNAQRKTIKQVFEHVGWDMADDDVQKIQENLFGGTHTFRKGQIDAWREAIPEELQKILIERIKIIPCMERLGYA